MMPPQHKSDKVKEELYCAVCMTEFGTRQSMRKHISRKSHTITNCSTLPDFLIRVLPPEKTLASKIHQVDEGFTAEVYLPTICTRERLHEWVDYFMKLNNCKYVRSRASKNATSSIIVQEHYQCEHHSSPNPVKRKKVSKGTNCRSTLYAVLKKSIQNITWIHINFVHNHSLTSPELLRFKKPTEDIRQIFTKMFEDGATPADALRYFKIHVRTQLTEKEYNMYSTDRSKVPDYDWARHFFHKTVKKKYTITKSPEYLNSIKEAVESYESQDLICTFSELENNNFFILIITPLMKRVLQTKQAGDLIFTDSCGNTERFGLKVLLLFTKIYSTEAPIGVIIVSQEITLAFIRAFKTFISSINSDAFDGKCKKGPNIILTDDNIAEIAAIRTVFTCSNDFLCISHFLRSCHRWLLKPKNEVNVNDRKTIYSLVRQMVFASNERTFGNLFTNLTQNFENHVPVKRFARQIFEKRRKWAHCFRAEALLDVDISCLMNFELRILKEQIFDKIKSQSAPELIRYMITEFNDFYTQKFIDCCLGNMRYFKTKELTLDDLNNYVLIQISDSHFVAYNKSKNIKYVINSDIGVCTCFIGVSGNFCKHQQLLSKSKKAFYTPMLYPHDDQSKGITYYIATGSLNITENLHNENIDESVFKNVVEEHYNIIEEVTEEIVDIPHSEEIAEHLSNAETDCLVELNGHITDLCKIISRDDRFLEALANVNQQLDLVEDSPSKLLEAMLSFNNGKKS